MIPVPLIDSLHSKKCLFFIGSGMSTDAGLPDSDELVQLLVKKMGINDKNNKGDLKQVSQQFVEMFGRSSLLSLIRDIFIDKNNNLNKLNFDVLSRLSPKPVDIITTNWDHLIEEALGQKNFEPIFLPESVPRYQYATINLFKIHGDIERDIVITKNDYLNYMSKWKSMVTKIKSLFQEKVIVFIGYSVEDPNILSIYNEIRKDVGEEYLQKRYFVTRKLNELKRGDLTTKGLTPIEMPIEVFFKTLEEELDISPERYQLISPKTVPSLPDTDHNPFQIFRAEDTPSTKWLNEAFIKPSNFSVIAAPGNVILEGHRGSGKSMILQYMSYIAQCLRNERTSYVGFYLKLQNSFIETVKKRDMEKEDWREFFLHYFNLLLGESILISLIQLKENNSIKGLDERNFVKRVIFRNFSDLTLDEDITNLYDLRDVFIRERNRCAKYPRPIHFRLSPHFIYDFIDLVQEYIISMKNKYFYILIDEYERLDDDQQKVLNIYISDRGAAQRYKVSFKIAVKTFGMNYSTIDDEILEIGDDYTWTPIDRFPENEKNKFTDMLLEIADRRLAVYDYNKNNIIDMFPPNNRGFENKDYSGLKNLLTLSSFLIRDFLELLKDMVYYTHPWIMNEKRDMIPPIPPKDQNYVIKIHSNILNSTKIDEIPEEINGVERKYIARNLIDGMGIIFQRILKGSKSKEKRTVSSFQLRNEIKLSGLAKAALEDCRRIGVLQVPFMRRAPQNYSRHAPHRNYEFHRLLCPRFYLSLAKRWPKEIDAELFNLIFINKNDAVNDISYYFIENIFIDDLLEVIKQKDSYSLFYDQYKEYISSEGNDITLFGEIIDVDWEYKLDGWTKEYKNIKVIGKITLEQNYLDIFLKIGFDKILLPDNINEDKLNIFIKNFSSIYEIMKAHMDDYNLVFKNTNNIIKIIWSGLLYDKKI